MKYLTIAHLSLFIKILQTNAWGNTGHDIVSKTASRLIHPKTDRFLRGVVGCLSVEEFLLTSGGWADSITDERPETSKYHFANIAYQSCDKGFVVERDCPEGSDCIVRAIDRFVKTASLIDSNHNDRREAVMFLVHLMADLHQPLHLGFKEDNGGNSIFPTIPGANSGTLEKPLSLHEIWDFDLTHQYMNPRKGKDETVDSITETFVKELSQQTRQKEYIKSELNIDNSLTWIESIASETVSLFTCNKAYMDEGERYIDNPNDKEAHTIHLSPRYYPSRADIALRQLKAASVRLAQILDFIAKSYFDQQKIQSDSERSSKPKEILLEEEKKTPVKNIFEIS